MAVAKKQSLIFGGEEESLEVPLWGVQVQLLEKTGGNMPLIAHPEAPWWTLSCLCQIGIGSSADGSSQISL